MKLTAAFGQFYDSMIQQLDPALRATWALRGFGLSKVPLLLFCLPAVDTLDDSGCVIKIPLTWRTRNHYRSMYFGALAVGVDCAAGLLAMHHIDQADTPVQLLFKDFHASFLRRPEADVHFVCREGAKVRAMVAKAIATGERINEPLQVLAIVPSESQEPAAVCTVTLSLKAGRGKRS